MNLGKDANPVPLRAWRGVARLSGAFCWLVMAAAAPAQQEEARRILKESGVAGGFVAHLGCGDGKLTAALRAGDGYVVQGWERDGAKAEEARRNIRAAGLYGPVSADRLGGGTLPYIDNFVRLLVVSDDCGVSRAEMERALCPGGVAMFLGQGAKGGHRRWEKPWPAGMDEWTHSLHGPGNNPVSKDTLSPPLARLQWTGGPRFSRHHDHMSSFSACVSAGGRVFYIMDEAPRSTIFLPPHWKLIARDAFSGVILWKRDIPQWHNHLHGLKSGPAELPKRLVAAGGRVYVTLGIKAPVSALDAATGATLRELEGTAGASQIIVRDGVLYAGAAAGVVALDAAEGRALWRHEAKAVGVNTLCAGESAVCFADGPRVVALDPKNGGELWRSEELPVNTNLKPYFAPSLVIVDGKVLYSGGENYVDHKGSDGTMIALDLATGKKLWATRHPPSGYQSPEDVIAIGGTVWCGDITSGVKRKAAEAGEAREVGTGIFTGVDLGTGEPRKSIASPDNYYWFHHRCYQARATERFLLTSRTGIEFVDVASGAMTMHHWVRGACLLGIMPANGMVYAPPHPCACYLMAKLSGFAALAPASAGEPPRDASPRLEKGPAFGKGTDAGAKGSGRDWPMYRGDAERSGFTPAPVAANLGPGWRAKLPGKITPPVVAENRLLVAVPERHSVHALGAADGKPLWEFTAGGPVDSPPSCANGRVLFGSGDGWIYCLDAASGDLAWRYRAAPTGRRHMFLERIESTHPVHGSVLVRDGKVYAVAGRYRFLDGGLHFVVLDLASGGLLSETVLGDKDAAGNLFQLEHDVLNMPAAAADILVAEGERIFMKNQEFAPDGTPKAPRVPHMKPPFTDEGPRHLLSPTGLLDDSEWHRSYWVYGTTFFSGHNGYYVAGQRAPAGRVLVFNGDTVFGYGRRAEMYKWSTPMEYTLFAARKDAPVAALQNTNETARATGKGAEAAGAKAGAGAKEGGGIKKPAGGGVAAKFERLWEQEIPVQVRGLALAGDRLLVAGVKDVLDETKAREDAAGWARQEEHITGKHGSMVWAMDAKTGEKLSEWNLDLLPVFDGVISAGGRVFVAGEDGTLECLGGD